MSGKRSHRYARLKQRYSNLRETLSKIDSDIKDSDINPHALNDDQSKEIDAMKKQILEASKSITVEELNEVLGPICDYAKKVAEEAQALAKTAKKRAKSS